MSREDEDDEGDEMDVSDAAEDLEEIEDSGSDVEQELTTAAPRRGRLNVGFFLRF